MSPSARHGQRHRIDNVLPAGCDPLAFESLELMRRYLLETDAAGGYYPQIVLPEPESTLWVLFWFGVRRIDDIVDDADTRPLRSIGPHFDALWALKAFIAAAPTQVEPRRRVLEMSKTLEIEGRIRDTGRPPRAEDLFELWYYKDYIPTYVGVRLLLRDSPEQAVRYISMLVGAAMQWVDDLMDLDEDLALGKRWLCVEELHWLRFHWPGGSRAHWHSRLIDLREAICIQYLLRAYEAAECLTSPKDRRRATAMIETGLAFFEMGFFRSYRTEEAKPWAPVQKILELLPGQEAQKQHVIHAINEIFLALPTRFANLSAARRRMQRFGPIPRSLDSQRCLNVMERLETNSYQGASATPRHHSSSPPPLHRVPPSSRHGQVSKSSMPTSLARSSSAGAWLRHHLESQSEGTHYFRVYQQSRVPWPSDAAISELLTYAQLQLTPQRLETHQVVAFLLEALAAGLRRRSRSIPFRPPHNPAWGNAEFPPWATRERS